MVRCREDAIHANVTGISLGSSDIIPDVEEEFTLAFLGMWTSFITINHNCVDEETMRDEKRCRRM